MSGWGMDDLEPDKNSEKDTIIKALAKLIKEARDKKRIIVVEYQNLRYFPNEFEQIVMSEHRFLWGIENFRLESPTKYINECQNEIDQNRKNIADFHIRMIHGF